MSALSPSLASKNEGYHAVSFPSPVRHATPPRSPKSPNTTTEPTGAAQFLTNLSERQKVHLKFAVAPKDEPERFSKFLETPRRTPVPDRFTFDSLQSETRKARDSSSTDAEVGRGSTTKSNKSNKTYASSRLANDNGYESDRSKSRATSRSRSRSRNRAISPSSLKRESSDLKRETGHLKPAADNGKWKFYATGCCLSFLNLVVAWDATSVSISLPTIATSLQGSAIQSFWLGISFLLAATIFLPLFSAFSDIFGRKAMLLAGLTFFTIGSLIAAISGNFTGLHLGRSVQGIGAGGIFVLSGLIVSDLVDPLDKRRWSAILGAMWAIGSVTGPVLGEFFAQRNQWRWIFWLNIPFCVLSFFILPFFAQLKSATPGSIAPKLRRFDWTGCILLTASLLSVLLGVSWGGILYSWTNPRTLLPLQFGLVGIVLFFVWSWFSPFPPMVSLDGFMNRTSLATYFGAMIQSCIMCAFLYFMPLYFGIIKTELGIMASGVRWFAWTLPLAFFVLVTFIIVSRWNAWLLSIWLGWSLVLLGAALTTMYSRTSPNTTWACIAIVLGSGIGILHPSLHTASELIASQLDDKKTRKSVTNFGFFQFLGKTFGVAIGTSVFENELFTHLRSNADLRQYAKQYTRDAVALVIKIREQDGKDGSARAQVADAYVASLKTVWITMAALAGLMLVFSWFMVPREPKRDRDVELKKLDESYVV